MNLYPKRPSATFLYFLDFCSYVPRAGASSVTEQLVTKVIIIQKIQILSSICSYKLLFRVKAYFHSTASEREEWWWAKPDGIYTQSVLPFLNVMYKTERIVFKGPFSQAREVTLVEVDMRRLGGRQREKWWPKDTASADSLSHHREWQTATEASI